MTTGPARSEETSPELSLVYKLNVKVTSVQNYDCEVLQNCVKSNVTYNMISDGFDCLKLFAYLVSLINNRDQINFKSNYLKQHP